MECTALLLPFSKMAMFLSVAFYLLGAYNAYEYMIDKDQLKQYPYCGSMYHSPDGAAGRAANAKNAKKDYRWQVGLLRANLQTKGNLPKTYKKTYCSGSVITDRHVLTAGHCVCSKRGDHHNDYLCLSDPSKSQVVDGSNIIYAFGGSRSTKVLLSATDSNNPFKWKVTKAYIMEGSSEDKWDKYDIGMAIIPENLGSDKRFFDKNALMERTKLGKAKIVPICLAALNTDFKDKTIRGVGWGSQYEESPDKINDKSNRDPIISSCMTNQAGPQEWKFQNCDMQEIKKQSWECDTTHHPPGYNTPAYSKKCDDYFITFGQHEDPLQRPDLPNYPKFLEERLKKVDKMYIIDEGGEEETCYLPRLLSETGWCKLEYQANNKEVAWGICSPSCRTDIMKPGKANSENYQEWEWTVNTSPKNTCTKIKKWDSNYMLCMKMELPKAKTVTFRRKPGSDPQWGKPEFGQEDTPAKIESYRVPCGGDSGSGQFFATHYYTDPGSLSWDGKRSLRFKFILAAVFVAGFSEQFQDSLGKEHEVPCGTYTSDSKKKDDLQYTANSQSTTWPEIFNWIKKNAKI